METERWEAIELQNIWKKFNEKIRGKFLEGSKGDGI